jgi:soluble lytic murein transglycosylase
MKTTSRNAPRMRFRSFAVASLLALAMAASAGADSVVPFGKRTAMRAQFLLAYAAAKLGGNGWRALSAGLEDYPLYPYLEGTALEHDIGTASATDIEHYLERYPDLIPARDLRRDYLHRLAGAKDWTAFHRWYQPGLGQALACDELQSRIAEGSTLDFDRDLSSLWQASSALPAACKPVLQWASDHHLLTRARLWQRVEQLAQDGGSAGAIGATAQWMDKNDATLAKRVALARRSPVTAIRDAAQWKDDPHTRVAVHLALLRQARHDEDAAAKAWRHLAHRFAFDAKQRHEIEAAIALYSATSFAPDALQRLRALPKAAQNAATREWRVRLELAKGDWKQALAALDALDADQQADETWRYWRARALANLGRDAESHTLFAELARQSDYYGYLAADRIGQPYAICPAQLAGSADDDRNLLAVPPLDRAFELHVIGLLPLARREWNQAMGLLDDNQRRLAADLATRSGWYDRAVFTLNSGDNLRLYAQRFPLARQQQVLDNARAAGIDPAWAYAIIRAESAWAEDAHSGADARGLMQLLPHTAREVARKNQLPYRQAADLYDPDVNIPLGTRYLAQMAARYGGAPWLASAAYNAGAGNVARWLDARGALEPDIFIDTIPFNETRAYVRRVLSFSVVYDWRLNGAALPLATRMPKIGEGYTLPDAKAARKKVVCPTAAAAPAPAPASSVPPAA